MTPTNALESPIFLTYLAVIGGLLGGVGLLLVVLSRVLGKQVGGVVRTYVGWLIITPIVLAVIFFGRAPTIIGVALLAIFGFKEFARATGLYDDWSYTATVYLGIAAVAVAALVGDPRSDASGWYGLFAVLPVYVVSTILVIPILRNRARGHLQRTSLAVLSFVYLGWMFGHVGFLANAPQAYGYLLYLLVAVEVNDVAAFTCGKFFGRSKLRSEISPNKTVGGAVGALCVSLVLPWLFRFSFPHFDAVHLVATGLIVGIGGQLGDLTISFIKRDIGIKDMGAVIPGHGGLLDRMDSLIFVGPLFFHMVRWSFGMV